MVGQVVEVTEILVWSIRVTYDRIVGELKAIHSCLKTV
jgi:hypothetical protein